MAWFRYLSNVIEGELTLHHYGWQVVSVVERYVAFYYREQHYPPTRGFRQPDTPKQPQGRLGTTHEDH